MVFSLAILALLILSSNAQFLILTPPDSTPIHQVTATTTHPEPTFTSVVKWLYPTPDLSQSLRCNRVNIAFSRFHNALSQSPTPTLETTHHHSPLAKVTQTILTEYAQDQTEFQSSSSSQNDRESNCPLGFHSHTNAMDKAFIHSTLQKQIEIAFRGREIDNRPRKLFDPKAKIVATRRYGDYRVDVDHLGNECVFSAGAQAHFTAEHTMDYYPKSSDLAMDTNKIIWLSKK